MLEALNIVGGIAQPIGLRQDMKNIPFQVASTSMKLLAAMVWSPPVQLVKLL